MDWMTRSSTLSYTSTLTPGRLRLCSSPSTAMEELSTALRSVTSCPPQESVYSSGPAPVF